MKKGVTASTANDTFVEMAEHTSKRINAKNHRIYICAIVCFFIFAISAMLYGFLEINWLVYVMLASSLIGLLCSVYREGFADGILKDASENIMMLNALDKTLDKTKGEHDR